MAKRWRSLANGLLLCVLASASAAAQAQTGGAGGKQDEPGEPAEPAPQAFGARASTPAPAGEASSTVWQGDLAERVPRSAPDALRYECPPPEAPTDECLVVVQQARTLGYLALRGDAGRELRELDLNVSVRATTSCGSTSGPGTSAVGDALLCF